MQLIDHFILLHPLDISYFCELYLTTHDESSQIGTFSTINDFAALNSELTRLYRFSEKRNPTN